MYGCHPGNREHNLDQAQALLHVSVSYREIKFGNGISLHVSFAGTLDLGIDVLDMFVHIFLGSEHPGSGGPSQHSMRSSRCRN